MAIAPAPTAEATRLTDPCLTSPAAKTPGMLVSNIRGGRSSGHASRPSPQEVGPGHNVAALVALDLFGQPVRAGLRADEDEQGRGLDGLRDPVVLEDQALEPALAAAPHDPGVQADVDVSGGLYLPDQVLRHARGEVVAAHEQRHARGVPGEVRRPPDRRSCPRPPRRLPCPAGPAPRSPRHRRTRPRRCRASSSGMPRRRYEAPVATITVLAVTSNPHDSITASRSPSRRSPVAWRM